MTPAIIEQNKTLTNKKSWTAGEDQMLIQLVLENGDDGKWSHIAKKMNINRSGKQCRERYHNHLKPEIKKGNWTKEEDALIIELSNKIGNQWARISKFLPGRSDNAIKNRFHAILNRKTSESGFDEVYLMHEISHSKLSTYLKPEVLQTISKASDEAFLDINVSNDNDNLRIDLNLLFHSHCEYEHERCEYEEHYDYSTTTITPMMKSSSLLLTISSEEFNKNNNNNINISHRTSSVKKSSSSEIHDKMIDRQFQSFSPVRGTAVNFQTSCEGPNSNSSLEWETIEAMRCEANSSLSYDTFFNSPIEIMKSCEESWMDDLIQLVDNPIPSSTFNYPLIKPVQEDNVNEFDDNNDNNVEKDEIAENYAMKLKKLAEHSPRSSAHPYLKKLRQTYPVTTSIKRNSQLNNTYPTYSSTKRNSPIFNSV